MQKIFFKVIFIRLVRILHGLRKLLIQDGKNNKVFFSSKLFILQENSFEVLKGAPESVAFHLLQISDQSHNTCHKPHEKGLRLKVSTFIPLKGQATYFYHWLLTITLRLSNQTLSFLFLLVFFFPLFFFHVWNE